MADSLPESSSLVSANLGTPLACRHDAAEPTVALTIFHLRSEWQQRDSMRLGRAWRPGMKVTVVGGGVVALATAHSLVESGCDVVLLEALDIPNPGSASCDLNRMMRLQYGPQSGYARLAQRALAAWKRLQDAYGQRLYHQTGACRTGPNANVTLSTAPRVGPCPSASASSHPPGLPIPEGSSKSSRGDRGV